MQPGVRMVGAALSTTITAYAAFSQRQRESHGPPPLCEGSESDTSQSPAARARPPTSAPPTTGPNQLKSIHPPQLATTPMIRLAPASTIPLPTLSIETQSQPAAPRHSASRKAWELARTDSRSPYYPKSLDSMNFLRQLDGSTKPRLYEESNGRKWVVKAGAGSEHAENEYLANRLYDAAGANVPPATLLRENGKSLYVHEYIEGRPLYMVAEHEPSPESDRAKKAVCEHFIVDAFVGGGDTVGRLWDNVVVGDDGRAYRIDVGESLGFKARGGQKRGDEVFNFEVNEVDLYRDQNHPDYQFIEPIYRGVTDADLRNQTASLLERKDAILAVVPEHRRTTVHRRLAYLEERYLQRPQQPAEHPSYDSFYLASGELVRVARGSVRNDGLDAGKLLYHGRSTTPEDLFSPDCHGNLHEATTRAGRPVYSGRAGVRLPHSGSWIAPSTGYDYNAATQIVENPPGPGISMSEAPQEACIYGASGDVDEVGVVAVVDPEGMEANAPAWNSNPDLASMKGNVPTHEHVSMLGVGGGERAPSGRPRILGAYRPHATHYTRYFDGLCNEGQRSACFQPHPDLSKEDTRKTIDAMRRHFAEHAQEYEGFD